NKWPTGTCGSPSWDCGRPAGIERKSGEAPALPGWGAVPLNLFIFATGSRHGVAQVDTARLYTIVSSSSSMAPGSAPRVAGAQGEFIMAAQPLMPKATAVWLVENTGLTFDQIADFCKLHPLEVKAIADDEGVQSIIGRDPVVTGQLTRDELAKGEADPNYRLRLADAKVHLPEPKRKKG